MESNRVLRLATLGRSLLTPFRGEERAGQIVGYVYAVSTLLIYSYKIQHSRAFLGVIWVLLTPLLFLLVYVPIFSQMSGTMAGAEELLGGGGLTFPLYVVLGFLTYSAFSESVTSGAGALVGSPSIIHNSPIPLSILPFVKVLRAIIALAVGCAIVFAIRCATAGFPGLRALLLLPAFLLLGMFSLGAALLLSAIAVIMRDVLQLLSTLLLIEFFAVPILYLPSFGGELTQIALRYNPLSPYLAMVRSAFFPKYPLTLLDLALGTIYAVVVLVSGYLVFRRLEGNLAEYT